MLESACAEDEKLLKELEEAISYLRNQTWRRTERIVNNMRVVAGKAAVFDIEAEKDKQEGKE